MLGRTLFDEVARCDPRTGTKGGEAGGGVRQSGVGLDRQTARPFLRDAALPGPIANMCLRPDMSASAVV